MEFVLSKIKSKNLETSNGTTDCSNLIIQKKINENFKKINLDRENWNAAGIFRYVQYKKGSKSTTPNKETALTDVASGLIEYFNVMLGSQLLYKFERPQYAEVLQQHPDKPMAKLYGAEHLLRLFVKLGSMLAFTALDEKSIQILLVHLQDFLKYLVKNSSTLFNMQHFVNASPEYHRKAQ